MCLGVSIPVLFSDYLNHHQNWLLIIDNCNYYGDNEMLAVLKRYIPNQAPTGQILITSRTIQKLHKAAILEIGQMDEESSVAFVMDRSGCNDEMHARELARMLKYYPLAMETAAAFIENTPNGSFSRYIDLLEENGIGLLNEKYDIQDYDQTVQEVWNISIHNIERYGETSIERHCIRPCLWYCSMLNSSHIDLTLFAYLKHLFVYSNEAIEITDIEERLNNRDDTLIEEIAPLPIVCQNELSRNKLYSFLVKYSLLHAESGNYLYMHPVLQKVVFDSFNDPNGKLDMCWDLFRIHFFIWERSEAYHILNNGLCPLFIKLPLFSISDQTEHIYSLLCNIEVLLKESETNEEDEEWLKIYQLLYSGFGCYRLFLRGDYPQIQNDLYTLIDHFYESANNIDWHDHKNYCSFAASIYLYAIRYLYLKKPNVTAKYINAYIDIVRIMIENSPDDIFSNGRISLEMTVLFNINCLQLVFAYWTVNGNYKFSITGLESLLQRIKTILFHGDKTEILYFGNVYTPDILDDFHMVYRAWEAKDYRLLPEHWRYSHFETEKAFMERLKKEYGIK